MTQKRRKTSPSRKREASLRRRARRLFKRIPAPSLGTTARTGLLGIMVLGILAISLLMGTVLRAAVAADALNPFRGDELPTAIPNATPNPDFLAPTIAFDDAPEWEGTEPVTVLLMGGDTRPSEQGYRPRTDTMMLLTIDPEAKVASLLSIPRDLYVEVPGYGLQRVNTAYPLGAGDLAMQTLQYNLGVHVNYYVLVEFDAFITLVDEIGGIDINVPKTIYDSSYPDMNYGYDPFYIEAGEHHLDGETALKYARTRHTDNDFNRARRQQDVLFAIRERIFSLDMLPTLIQKAPSMYSTLSDSITTNMTMDEMISLARLGQDIERDDIRSAVIDSNYVMGHTTEAGAQVLIPNRDRIGELMAEMLWLDETADE